MSLAQAKIARGAHRDFGRGSGHPARLNYGDCFSYALAKASGEPLLWKGDDFGHTDARRPEPSDGILTVRAGRYRHGHVDPHPFGPRVAR